MCDLYVLTKAQDAIRRLFRVKSESDLTGNLPPTPVELSNGALNKACGL